MTAGEVADAGNAAPSGGGGPAPGIENDAESGDGDAGAKPEIERARECACAAGARPALNVRTYGDADAGGCGAALNVVRNGPADGGSARSVCAVGSVRSGGGNAMGSSLLARRRCVIILRDGDDVVGMNE
jgi:hypothetical protein